MAGPYINTASAALSAVAPLSCRKQTAQHVLATIGGSNGETPDGTWRGSTEWRGSIAGVRCVLHVLGLIAYGVYIIAMALGFRPRPSPPSLYWLVGVGLVLAGILYPLHKIANRP